MCVYYKAKMNILVYEKKECPNPNYQSVYDCDIGC